MNINASAAFPVTSIPRSLPTANAPAGGSPPPAPAPRPEKRDPLSAVVRAVQGVATTAADTVDASFGVEPTLSTLSALRAASDGFALTGFVPQTAADAFGKWAYIGFRSAAPLLDGIKLANTWKTSAALGRLKDPKLAGTAAVAKSKNWFNIGLDAAHLAVDCTVVAALAGAAFHVPFLSFMAPTTALSVGFSADVVAAAIHATGAASSLSDPSTGSSFGERWNHLVHTQGLGAMVGRVFQGHEPIQPSPVPPLPIPAPKPGG